MKSFRISLYGNLILDKVYCVESFAENESNACVSKSISLGGITNVLCAITELESKCKINISSAIGTDTNGSFVNRWLSNYKKINSSTLDSVDINKNKTTSEAIIISDTKEKKRTSVVSWGACAQRSDLPDFFSDWCHILYADKLVNLNIEELKKLSKSSIISIDLCSSNFSDHTRRKIINMLPYVDFVFASYEEGICLSMKENASKAAEWIAKRTRGVAVLHSPEGSFFCDKKYEKVYHHKVKEMLNGSINVLGAGDIFAASFIVSTLKEKSLADSIEFAHSNTSSVLEKRAKNGKI